MCLHLTLDQSPLHRDHTHSTTYEKYEITNAQLDVFTYDVKSPPEPFLGFQKMVYSLSFCEPPPPIFRGVSLPRLYSHGCDCRSKL